MTMPKKKPYSSMLDIISSLKSNQSKTNITRFLIAPFKESTSYKKVYEKKKDSIILNINISIIYFYLRGSDSYFKYCKMLTKEKTN